VAIDSPPVYEINGIVSYRASSLGGCVRMLALARQGYDTVSPPADMLEVFKAGHEAEREVWAKGIVKGRSQEYVQLPISDTIRVVGHLDCWDKECGSVYEIKSQSEDEWKPLPEGRLWERYKFQLAVYMHATGLPITVIRVKRGKEGIEGEAREVFEEPPVSLEDIRRRVFSVEMLARRDLSEVKCERFEFPCPFWYTHMETSVDEARETVDDPTAVVLARQYQNARLVAQIAEGRVKKSRGALLLYVGDRRKMELSDGTLLTRYEVKSKHVEYDRAGYWALKVTSKKESGGDGENGEASGDSMRRVWGHRENRGVH
jgi:hypothetical protein